MNEPLFKPIPSMPLLETASVRVLRSYDYCHFEICLTSNQVALGSKSVDEMRKEANRLADKAVDQYKLARATEGLMTKLESSWCLEQAEQAPEENRTPFDKAVIKAKADANFRATLPYDYQDDYDDSWQDDNRRRP